MAYPLDDYDKILLRHLQADASLSQQELGKIAHLSTAAVNRRLKLLQQAGVITHYSASLNPKALGCDLTVIVEVMVNDERLDLLEAMQRQFQRCEHVQQCYYIAGGCDFVLIFLVADMEQYVSLAHQLFHANSNVKSFKTLVAMNRVKTSMDVPIL
jgi:DNA-binding Lrp family transcriptional regulator